MLDSVDDKSLLDFATSNPAPAARSKPSNLADRGKGRVILTPGGEGYTRRIFGYHRAMTYAHPPHAIAHFAFSALDASAAESRFWAWFGTPEPQRELVVVHWDDEVIPVERDDSTGWTVRLELDLAEDLLTVTPQLLAHGRVFGEPFVPLGETLIFLPKVRRVAKLQPETSWSYWERLCGKLGRYCIGESPEMKRSRGEPITVRAEHWNDVVCEWEMERGSGKPPPKPPLICRSAGHEVLEFPVGEVSRSIDLQPSREGAEALQVETRMTVFGMRLPYASQILQGEHAVREAAGGTGLSTASKAAVVARCLRDCWLAQAEDERQDAIEALSSDAALRSPDAQRAVFWHVKAVLRQTEHLVGQDVIVPVAGHGWVRLVDPWQQGRLLAALARGYLGAVDFALRGGVFEVNAQEAFAGLPGLIEACVQHDVALTYSGQAMRSVSLDVRVAGETKGEELDWFEMRPEVRCDGGLIAQEHWEEIVSHGRWMAQSGIPVVIDVKSLESLRRLHGLWQKQHHEDDGQDDVPRAKRRTLLIPRLRILDWLVLSREGIACDIPEGERRVLESLLKFETLQQLSAPTGLQATLRPYQLEGYSWLAFLYQHGFGACLADDMGLGKTLQAITLLAGIAEGSVRGVAGGVDARPHLVVVPPSLLFNWTNEIQAFCPSLSVHEYTGASRSLDGIDGGVVLTTYELARRDIDRLKDKSFDVIIFDEAQAVKNLVGGRSQAMRQLQGRFKLCLTGTPMENHAGEYYSILELALPGLFGDYARFLQALRNVHEPLQPLQRARPFVLRRTKEKILTELPPKVEFDLQLDLSAEQKRYYTRAVGEVREEVLRAFADKTAQQAGIVALSALTRLRQICVSPVLLDPTHAEVSPKLAYLSDKLRELQEEGHAALVFSQFTKALDALEAQLKAADLDYMRLVGSTPQAKRKTLVESFQSGAGPGIFLISLKAGGAGLNLTRASYVFHLDPWWNPAVERQASDRAYRMGQTQRVFIQRLLMRHTVEEKITQLKARKQALFDQVMSGTEERASGGALITREDFGFLLGE
ncbi:MAG: DEAD/DEAH box helicase [Roseimicrobium sp.]